MKILEVPYIVEFFFVVSTIVFVVTLYAILPALVFNKRTLFNPLLINGLWQKVFKNVSEGAGKFSRGHKKKELKKALVVIRKN